MSISATTNYMSNADILEWMETKTDGLYGQMRDAMDVADTRADAEGALDDIKAALANSKNDGGDASKITAAINDALAKYPDVPEVAKVLQPMADKLNAEYAASATAANSAAGQLAAIMALPEPADPDDAAERDAQIAALKQQSAAAPINIASADADTWTQNITGQVDALGKQDQLGLVDIQEFNSELNEAKQTASALMDSADKSAEAVINHIS